MITASECVRIEATPADLANHLFNKDDYGFSAEEIADFFNHLGELVFSWDRKANPWSDIDGWFMDATRHLTPRGRDFMIAVANWITWDEKRFPDGKYGNHAPDQSNDWGYRYREQLP